MTGERQIPDSPTDQWAVTCGARLPEAADVVVVGGGIVGCSAALFLARRGISVVLCEKGRIAGEQSGRNWGWVRQQGRSPLELPLMIRSLEIWRGLDALVAADTGFVQGGCLYLAASARELEEHAAWLPIAAEHGLDTRLLSARELAGTLDAPAGRWSGALYTASDGRAEPARATPALARGAERAGAAVLTQCAVRGLELEAGRVAAVVTEHGRIRTGTVICAAGAWSSLFCGPLGVRVPQLRIAGTVARCAPTRSVLHGAAFSPRVAIRRRADGGYTLAHGAALEHEIVPDSLRFAPKFWPAWRQERGAIRLRVRRSLLDELRQSRRWPLDEVSPFERCRVLAPAPSRGILDEVRAHLRACFPEIADAPIVESWGGMIETSPDVLPIIGAVPTLPGFFLATGFSGHGFGIGPAAGRLVADLATGADPGINVQAFRLERFFDGSPIRPGPTI